MSEPTLPNSGQRSIYALIPVVGVSRGDSQETRSLCECVCVYVRVGVTQEEMLACIRLGNELSYMLARALIYRL